ncbi:MAG: hypothetical protein GAK30_01653 [Paracidovorax wautersii]|uniref:Uncharacterized protein n=1 Tax=Paracidovorax wautersii TaxID=1177982 RepID=A0A7V8JQU6_9BURK|nr:MAG: hypothetical protein GAK30_01653 [Paracidovorax wautersii]
MSKPDVTSDNTRGTLDGKLANDRNKAGHQPATQRHESQRTPHSRSDRESHIGSSNQQQSRRGGAGS